MLEANSQTEIKCSETLKSFIKSRKRQGCQFSLCWFNIVIKVRARLIRQVKDFNEKQIKKEEVKILLIWVLSYT